jgi:hypothetical protein
MKCTHRKIRKHTEQFGRKMGPWEETIEEDLATIRK